MDRNEQPSKPTPLAQRWVEGLLAIAALVLVWRAASLAFAPIAEPPGVPGESHRVVAAAPTAELPAPKTLTESEYAAIVGLCPASASQLPPELLPPTLRAAPREPGETPAAPEPMAATGRLTGLRIASRADVMPLAVNRFAQASEPADGWLVSPDAWYSPEDRDQQKAKVASSAEPTSEDAAPRKPAKTLDATPPTADWKPQPTAPEAKQDKESPRAAETPLAAKATTHSKASPQIDSPDKPSETSPPETAEALAREPTEAKPATPTFAPPGVAAPEVGEEAETPSDALPIDAPSDEPPSAEETPIDGLMANDPTDEPATPAEVGPRWEGPFDAVAPEATESPAEEPPYEEPAAEEPATQDAPSEETAEEPMPIDETPPVDREITEELPAPRDNEEAEAETRLQPEPEAEPLATAQEPAPEAPEPVEPEAATPSAAAESLAPTTSLFAAPTTAAPSPSPTPQPTPYTAPGTLFGAPGAVAPLNPHTGGAQAAAATRAAAGGKSADESHRELYAKNCYPSAQQCAECHQQIYDQWSVSSHAYAYVSPMFHKFEQTITNLSNGTVGHFCTRCHSPVAVAMYEPRSTPLGEMADAAREGVTCIACHRVNQRWGKSNGERRIETGDAYAAVYGGIGGDGVAEVIAKKSDYKIKVSSEEKGPGVGLHIEGRFFDQITHAEACTSCHQVAVHPGVKLEVVWEQYRASPACKKGITCQECHMGRVPGLPGGYDIGSIAEINGKSVSNQRKVFNHVFYGPGYSIAHPGLFPLHKDSKRWTFEQWTAFDWRAGWGTEAFEEKVEEAEDAGADTSDWFPAAWADADDRYDAREVVDDNLEKLKTKRRYRELVMENGSKVDGPFFRSTPTPGRDLEFDYVVTNLNEGHNLPTASLGAQPQLWANVVLIGPDGRRLWESGYTDSNGDLCDIHSVDVRRGRAPFDRQLLNLQTMFLITGATGTDREFYLPVNLDIDQVAQLRPGAVPYTVLNHPPFIRMESRSLAPLGKKRAKYTVPAELMQQPGRYRLSFRLRSRTEPMYFMRLCEATPEMLRSMVEGTLDIHPQSVEFEVY